MVENEEDLSVIKRITKLQEMCSKDLLKVWYTMFDHEPDVASKQYMTAKLAYKIQELAYGGLDAETENKIKTCAKEVTKKNASPVAKKSHKFCPMIGTKIVKEYKDKVHEIMVVNDGFSYEGEVYKSLSAIATKITGTKWNGLKFFNLKG